MVRKVLIADVIRFIIKKPMHELSVAVSLLEIAEQKAREEGAERISRLFLRIGPLSGIVPDALRFAFEVAAEPTLARDAVLEIENVPVVLYCSTCEREAGAESTYAYSCPHCGRPTHDVRGGNELEITSMEIE